MISLKSLSLMILTLTASNPFTRALACCSLKIMKGLPYSSENNKSTREKIQINQTAKEYIDDTKQRQTMTMPASRLRNDAKHPPTLTIYHRHCSGKKEAINMNQ